MLVSNIEYSLIAGPTGTADAGFAYRRRSRNLEIGATFDLQMNELYSETKTLCITLTPAQAKRIAWFFLLFYIPGVSHLFLLASNISTKIMDFLERCLR